MGNLRKVRNRIKSQTQVIDTNIDFGGHKVFVAVPNGQDPNVVGKAFGEFMQLVISRARQPNMNDFYKAHFGVLEKIKNNENLN